MIRVAEMFDLNKGTVTEFYGMFRDFTQQWFEREVESQNNPVLGGPGWSSSHGLLELSSLFSGIVVEIDETLMFKAKHNRGRMLNRDQIWVFGMLERGSNKVRLLSLDSIHSNPSRWQ